MSKTTRSTALSWDSHSVSNDRSVVNSEESLDMEDVEDMVTKFKSEILLCVVCVVTMLSVATYPNILIMGGVSSIIAMILFQSYSRMKQMELTQSGIAATSIFEEATRKLSYIFDSLIGFKQNLSELQMDSLMQTSNNAMYTPLFQKRLQLGMISAGFITCICGYVILNQGIKHIQNNMGDIIQQFQAFPTLQHDLSSNISRLQTDIVMSKEMEGKLFWHNGLSIGSVFVLLFTLVGLSLKNAKKLQFIESAISKETQHNQDITEQGGGNQVDTSMYPNELKQLLESSKSLHNKNKRPKKAKSRQSTERRDYQISLKEVNEQEKKYQAEISRAEIEIQQLREISSRLLNANEQLHKTISVMSSESDNFKNNLKKSTEREKSLQANISMATNENKQLRDTSAMIQSEKEKLLEKISGLESKLESNVTELREMKVVQDTSLLEREDTTTEEYGEETIYPVIPSFSDLTTLTESSFECSSPVWALASFALHNKHYVASGHEDGSIKVWSVDDAALSDNLTGHTMAVVALTIFEKNDTNYLVSGSSDSTIKIWNLESGNLVANLKGHSGAVTDLVSYRQGNNQILVSGSRDMSIKLWNLESHSLIATMQGHTGYVRALTMYEHGCTSYLASGSYDNTVKLWDLNSRSLITTLTGHTGWVVSLAVMQVENRTILASGSWDKSIKLWDVDNHSCTATLTGHTDFVWSLSVIKCEGKMCLVSGSYDNAVRVWSIDDHSVIKTLSYGNRVWALTSFQHEESVYLVAGGKSGKIQLWNE